MLRFLESFGTELLESFGISASEHWVFSNLRNIELLTCKTPEYLFLAFWHIILAFSYAAVKKGIEVFIDFNIMLSKFFSTTT